MHCWKMILKKYEKAYKNIPGKKAINKKKYFVRKKTQKKKSKQ